MLFSLKSVGAAVLSLAVAVTSVVAQTGNSANPITEPTAGTVIAAGTNFVITWEPTGNGSVSLALGNGPADSINVVSTIVSGIPNSGSFSWAVPSSLPAGTDYTIKITGPGDLNFSPRFTITSTVSSTSSAASTTASSSSATSSSETTSTGSSSVSSAASSSASASASHKSSGSATVATTLPSLTSTPPNSSSDAGRFSIGSTLALVGAVVVGVFAF